MSRSNDRGRLRVLFWNQEYWPSLGGVEIQTQNMARCLAERGHAVAVVAGLSRDDLPPIETVDGIPVHRLPFFQALSARDAASIAALIHQVRELKENFRPDVVHVNLTDGSPYFHLRTTRLHERTVVVFHVVVANAMRRGTLLHALLERADQCVAPSAFVAENVKTMFGSRPDHLTIIQNGVPDAAFLSIGPLDRVPGRFLFAGRLVPEKGVEVAIDAVSSLSRNGVQVILDVVGGGPSKAALIKRASDLGLADQIVFSGILPQAQLAVRLQHACALLAPSRFDETFSQVAAEAALAGRPVIASRRAALVETVLDDRSGLHFDEGSPEALSRAMMRVLEEPGLARSLGEFGRAYARENFTLSAMVKRYTDLYRKLIAPPEKQHSTGPN